MINMSNTFSIRVRKDEGKESIEEKITLLREKIQKYQENNQKEKDHLHKELDVLLANYYEHADLTDEILASRKFPEVFKVLRELKGD